MQRGGSSILFETADPVAAGAVGSVMPVVKASKPFSTILQIIDISLIRLAEVRPCLLCRRCEKRRFPHFHVI